MRGRRSVSGSIFAAVALLASNGNSQAQKSIPSRVGYLTRPINVETKSLGPNFKGHDIRALVAEIRHSGISAKSEFETTAEHKDKVAAFLDRAGHQFLFSPSDDLRPLHVESHFDADLGQMNVKFGLEDNHYWFNDEADEDFEAGLVEISEATLLDAITRGHRKTVVNTYGIFVSGNDPMFTPTVAGKHREAALQLDMPVNEARAQKPFMRVALLCTISSPRVLTGQWRMRDVDILSNGFFVEASIDELWVYDGRDGKVLGKYLPETAK